VTWLKHFLSPKALLVFGALGRDGITQVLTKFQCLRAKRRKFKPPGSGSKFIYTSNYVAKAVLCFANDPNAELLEHDVESQPKL